MHVFSLWWWAVNDNLFPLMGQLLMDIYYAPDFLQLPRAHLTNLAPAQERMLTIDEVPHNELLKSLLSEEVDWKSEQHNLCVRRVVFGVGSRLMYHHLLRRMRHEVGDLIHLYAKHYYCHHAAKSSPSRGDHFSRICSGTAKKTTSSKLKLVIYSRGNTGKRRSIANEDLLVNRLQQLDNFDVTYVHDYPKQSAQQDKTKPDHNPQEVLLDRLEAVLDADIVIGLHGAALANVIFAPRNTLLIELKSTYGYSLDLFAVMSESRYGDFAQVDLKGNPRDKLSMDPGIVDRIVAIIQEARPSSNQQTKQSKAWRDSSIRQFGSKLDLLVTNEAFNKGTAHHNLSNPIDSDIFGPSLVSSMHQQCATMTISDYWKAINTDYVQLKYCQGCPRNPS